MRGKVILNHLEPLSRRITPAYAGKSDHSESWNFHLTGSPPPMRGKVSASRGHVETVRITPAYAGKRLCKGTAPQCVRDHPRLCGEKETDIQARNKKAGSPPPMRGKEPRKACGDRQDGITPAYAGKSNIPKEVMHAHAGSPPPMRGKVQFLFQAAPKCRITPAYAGKSWIPITQFFNVQDHPRLCGEKQECCGVGSLPWGSPPPMRGKD